MPGGRPMKRRAFNLPGSTISAAHEESPTVGETSNGDRPIRAAMRKALGNVSNFVDILTAASQESSPTRERKRRRNELPSQRSQRLEQQRQRNIAALSREDSEGRDRRLQDLRNRDVQRRNRETADERDRRLQDLRNRGVQRRNSETADERNRRLKDLRNHYAQRRNNEAAEERNQRLEDLRNRRNAETIEERHKRLEEQRRRDVRRNMALEQDRLPTYKSAGNSSNVPYNKLGPFEVACIHCGALHFPEERVSNSFHRDSFGDCCLHGRIEMEPPQFPNELVRLFIRRHDLAEEFHTRIRNLNSCFALASFNVDDDRTISSRGIYSFVANGQVYHKMNLAAHPTQNSQGINERPQYGQMYFMDSMDSVEQRLQHPLNQGISHDLMNFLEQMMRSVNPFVQGYMMMREVEEDVNQIAAAQGISPPQVQLLFTLPEGADYRRFNVPTSNEVCAVLTLNADQSFPSNEIVVRQRGKKIVTLRNTDNRVEPFTYPLFYPNGTFGFSVDMPLKTPYASRSHITRLELARYRMAFRPELTKPLTEDANTMGPDLRPTNFNSLHFGGRLFQQYLVDTYIRVERDRIQWIKANQQKLLADQYAGVNTFIKKLADEKKIAVGEKVILPSSFPGSSRYFTEHFEDAMAIVRRLGSPDFFITMTCSPEWPEMKEASQIVWEDGVTLQQLTQDRPDLVARIAKIKFNNFIDDLDKHQIFGKVAAYMGIYEHQRRGLPHLHILAIMSPEDKIHSPEQLDDFISAEIPDNDPELRQLVLKWMIHNPCGELNPNASCMVNKNGRVKCRFDFPKEYKEFSSLADNEKPHYRRRYNPKLDLRNPEFLHDLAIYRKDFTGKKITRDNRHVAAYNGYLLKKYQCHINVEFVGSIRAVKYLYKYIYKGHDCAAIKIVENQQQLIYNEANTYVQGRCITPPEACWRLMGNDVQKRSHTVQRLDIHLQGQYRMNPEQAQEDLADMGQKGSTLEAYFAHNLQLKNSVMVDNESSEEVPNYYFYWQMPEHFRWVGTSSKWVPRIRRVRVIGRIHSVSFISQPELYHLRLLLYHVKNATCFSDLLNVNGIQYGSYKQACLARGLTFDDKQWIESLRESASSKMPSAMRLLFTQILILGAPENPKRLWEMFCEDLAEDFIFEAVRHGETREVGISRAYRLIAHKLNTEATEGRDFKYWVERFGMDDIEDDGNEFGPEIIDHHAAITEGQRMYRLLKEEQKKVVDSILSAVCKNSSQSVSKCYFVDGPGGTGKTFVYKTLYHLLCGMNYVVKCMAFTGIAAILLPEGRTCHKTFGLKVPLTAEAISSIKPGSPKANELAKVAVFLMDEAPMLPKYGLQNMDQLLRAIGDPLQPFGGKVVVLGGDFRQCLPVQPRANRSELLDLCIKRSLLWQHFTYFSLTQNMRVDPQEKDFADYLLKVGNGEIRPAPNSISDEIPLPSEIISCGDLVREVFQQCLDTNDFESMKDRAILAPLNKTVVDINTKIMDKLPGSYTTYHSYDSTKDEPDGGLTFTPEFLNSIDIADLPPHELKLKQNTIIILLRNLDASEGLCNGTRLTVTDLCPNIIKAKIITGEKSGREVHIPRVTLDSSKSQLGCTLQRHQFPVKPAFAMTVHKAQGQTFEHVGVDLSTKVFMHGMLYVAFSRVKRRSGLKVLLPPENPFSTRNIVWKEVL